MKLTLLIITLLTFSSGYAQTENFWFKRSDFSGLKRERAVAFTVDNYAYVGTGVDTAEMVLNDFWKYDALLDSWTQVATLPGDARRNAVAFSIGTKGYVGTGFNANESAFGNALNDFYEYNTATNAWSPRANYPSQPTYFATGFAVESKGYICAGKRGPNWYTTEFFEYDPATDSWSSKPPFPGGVRYQLSSFVVGNSGFVGLGTDQDMYRNDIWEFKPSANQWAQKADLPASERAASHTFAIGNRGFICMGTNGGLLDDLWEFNPYDNTWESRATYGGSRRKGGVAFVLHGKAYLGTGKGYSGKKQSMWEYTPSATVSLSEMQETEISIYPNPAVDIIHIETSGNTADELAIYSLQGQRIQSTPFVNTLNVSGLTSGVYMLIATNSAGEIIGKQKLIKQ